MGKQKTCPHGLPIVHEGFPLLGVKTMETTPAMKIINGKPCVRVLDLANMWHTSTASILATGKPHHIPEEFLRRIDGRVWCQLAGLRYRLKAVKQDSNLNWCIREFLDTQEEKRTKKTPSQPAATDLGTADLIADARRTASQALAKAENNEKRVEKLEKQMDAVRSVVKSAANVAEEASEAVDGVESTVCGEMERVTRLYADVDKAKKKVRALDWTLAVVTVLGVAAHVVRLLHRR